MTEMRDSWREVASKAEALGLKLRLHLEQEDEARRAAGGEAGPAGGQAGTASDETGTAGVGVTEAGETTGGGPDDRGATRAAVDELFGKLKDAFDSFGSAAKDPAVRADVNDIGVLLREALTVTFSSVGADVGDAMRDMGDAVKRASARSGGDGTPPPPPAGGPDTPPQGGDVEDA